MFIASTRTVSLNLVNMYSCCIFFRMFGLTGKKLKVNLHFEE